MLEEGKGKEPILEVSHLSKIFQTGRRERIKAVDDVSFSVYRGETLGLVGESGCGKTTCGRTAIGLYPRTDGSVKYCGKELLQLDARERRAYKRNVQMVFQDPYYSLDPRMKVGNIIAEGLRIHRLADGRKQERERVRELLELVGLHGEYAHRLPGEFSGGQRQRIGIARALALEPEFLLCDEPISALDVSIQVQIMNLLVRLKEECGLTYLFISHNLAAVKYISDRIAVMYMGKIVEMGETEEVYAHPIHPYTQALLDAASIPDPDVERRRERVIIKGETVQGELLAGCAFAPRCPYADKECREREPELQEVRGGHWSACRRIKIG